ncbi:MAG: LysR family transcriptional regulator [Pseudomonadota bacterium]
MDRQQIEALWTPLHWLTVLSVHGSYTAAANRLGVSKAAMSQRISELEKAAGVALVRRTTRSVQLTAAGVQLVENTQGAFEQIATSFSGVRNLAGTPSGKLRITAPVAFARQQLVHRIPEFMMAYPAVRIELEMSDQLQSLAREGFDLALRHTSTPPETHVAWTLARTHAVLVASRSYLKRKGSPPTPAALVQHDCLFYPRGQSVPTWSLRHRGANERNRTKDAAVVRVSGPFAANNSEALRDAAAAGLGIALLPDFSAQSALQSGKLVQVLPDWEPVESFGEYLYAVRPYAAHVPRAVAAFVEFLKQQYEDGFSA